jgi:hypothetical protein
LGRFENNIKARGRVEVGNYPKREEHTHAPPQGIRKYSSWRKSSFIFTRGTTVFQQNDKWEAKCRRLKITILIVM